MQEDAKTAEPPAQTDEDLVTLSTIHRAKGLEWQVVVLADCRPYHVRAQDSVLWDRERRAVICSRVAGAPTAAFGRWGKSPAASLDREERRRLVYVAMTRARDLLLVTTPRPGKDGEFVQLAEAADGADSWTQVWPRFAELEGLPWADPGGQPGLPDRPGNPVPGRTVSMPRLVQRWQEIEGRRQAATASPAQPAQLSFTALEVLESCPRQFWYQYLAHYPVSGPASSAGPDGAAVRPSVGGREQALTLGVTLHQVLERLHRESPDRAFSFQQALAALKRVAGGLRLGQREAAESMLRRYVSGPGAALPTVATEFAFSWAGWGSRSCPPLVGVIDRLARLPSGELLIIDYKTNLSLSESELVTYSRQLQLYSAAVAAGVMGSPLRAPATALLMLRTGELITVPSGAEERAAALSWAAAVAQRVAAGQYRAVEDFPDRPCVECSFVERCPERREDSWPVLVGKSEEA
jgi:ATP-dependent helicase/nuclease subunit A